MSMRMNQRESFKTANSVLIAFYMNFETST